MFKKNVLLKMFLMGICYTFFFYSNTAFCLERPTNIDWEQWRVQRDSSDTKQPAQRQKNIKNTAAKKRKNEAYELNRKGNQAYKSANWKGAVSYYREALNKSPNDKVIRQNLTNAQKALAKEYAKKKNATNLNKKGNQAYNSKNWRQAIDYYKNALKNSPNNRVIKQNLIYAQKALAKEYAKKKNATNLNKKGNQAYKSRNWRQAIDYYKNALGNSPNNRVIKKNLIYAQNALATEQRKKEKQQIEQKRKKRLATRQKRKIKEQKDKVLKLVKRFAAVSAEVDLPVSANTRVNEAICEQNSSFIEIMNSNAITPEEKRKYKLKLPILNKNVVPQLDMSSQTSASRHESFFTENLSMDQYVGSNLRGLDKVSRLFKEIRKEVIAQGISKTIDLLIGTIRNPRIATAMKGGKVVSNAAFDALNKFMEAAMKAVGGHHDSKQFWKDCHTPFSEKKEKAKTWTYWRRK